MKSLNNNLLQYMVNISGMNPMDVSHFRATCKGIYKGVNDTAQKYRECKTYNGMLCYACTIGHLEMAKWCVSIGATDFNYAMKYACSNGHLEVAKWCASVGATNFNWGMRNACENGQIEIAKWCASVGAIDFDGAMCSACRGGHLDVAKWCVSKGATAFDSATSFTPKKHTNVIEWLNTKLK